MDSQILRVTSRTLFVGGFYVLFRLWSEEDSNDKFENADVNRDKMVTWTEYKDEEYDGMDDWVDIEMDR